MKQLIVIILTLLVVLGFVVGYLLLDVDRAAMALYDLLGPVSSAAEPSAMPETEPDAGPATEEERTRPATGPPAEPPPPVEIGEEKYIYHHIGETEQALYLDIFTALSAFAPNLILSEEQQGAFDSDGILNVYNFVLDDNPALFWADSGITLSTLQSDDVLIPKEIRFSYLFDEEEAAGVRREIDAYEARCFAGLAPDAALFNKIIHVYQYVIEHTEYVLGSDYNQNLISVALYGESVCKGYAKMTQYLLNRLGIPCTTVNGYAGESHSWNLVDAGGDYYYLDPTWGDPQKLTPQGGEEQESYTSYRYFMVTDEELAFTHELDEVYPYPVCDSTALNYYVYTGRMFDVYDYDAVAALMRSDFLYGGDISSIRFGNEEAYQTAITMLVDEAEAHEILYDVPAYQDNGYAYSYSNDNDFRILDFML